MRCCPLSGRLLKQLVSKVVSNSFDPFIFVVFLQGGTDISSVEGE